MELTLDPEMPLPSTNPLLDAGRRALVQCCCMNFTEVMNGTQAGAAVGFIYPPMSHSLLWSVYNNSDHPGMYGNLSSGSVGLEHWHGGNFTNCSQEMCANVTCPPVSEIGQGNPYIQPWYIQIIYYFFFVTMVITATGGNLIVIWIVLAHKRMRTVTNFFLVNLAIADALISVLNTLFNFVYMLYSDWPFGRNYCKFVHFISPCAICASVFTFVAIAVDR